MREDNIRKIAFSYVGALAGSGFISGREVYQFFGRFGLWGIFGIIITIILMTLFIQAAIDLSKDEGSTDTAQIICGDNHFFRKISSLYFNVFYYSFIVIMTSGFGALINTLTGLNERVGTLFLVIVILIFSKKGVEGISKIMNILMPILFCFMIFICLFAIQKGGDLYIKDFKMVDNFFISSLSFFSYNSIIAGVSIFNAMYQETDGNSLKKGAVFGNILSFIILIMMIIPMILNHDLIKDANFPILTLAGLHHPLTQKIFNLILIAGFFSSGNALLFALIGKDREKSHGLRIIIMVSAYFVSFIGFKELVALIMPLTGYVGLIMIVAVFYRRAKL